MYDFGENIFMNNEKYLDELDGRLQVLNELRKRIIELSKAIIGDTLYKEDFFFTSAMDRSVVLLDGISEMIKNRNLACGGILYVRKGTWAGKPFELIDWQEQIIRDIGKIGTCGCSGTASDLWRWRRER